MFRFAAQSGNDVILDFNIAEDKLRFDADTGVRSSRTLDANGDGLTDLMLVLTGGGSVTLLGVSSLGDVSMDNASAANGGAQPAGWAAASADQHDAMALARLSGDHFAFAY